MNVFLAVWADGDSDADNVGVIAVESTPLTPARGHARGLKSWRDYPGEPVPDYKCVLVHSETGIWRSITHNWD